MKPAPPIVPPNAEWPADEIARLAGESGKPLEVSCAVAFIAADWEAWLGSHFDDAGRIRELDVLAEKTTLVRAAHQKGTRCTSRVLLSCKGFPTSFSPLTYSVSDQSVPAINPTLVANETALPSEQIGRSREFIAEMEEQGAARLLEGLGLLNEKRIVGFDAVERHVAKDKVHFSRARDGDHRIHGGIDSALKAAVFWNRRVPSGWGGDTQPEVLIHVPICLLSVPMWDVCIDGGEVGGAQVREVGFQTNYYPLGQEERQVTTIVASAAALDQVIAAVDGMHVWLCNLITSRYPLVP